MVLESEVPRDAPWSAYRNGTAEPLLQRRICDFYASIDVAIAWRPGGAGWPTHGHRLDPSCCYSKPAERFSNPAMLGIPAIGDRAYSSFAELAPRDTQDFLCEDVACVLDKLRLLTSHGGGWPRGSTAQERWRRLRERVQRDLDPAELRRKYVAVLHGAAVATCARMQMPSTHRGEMSNGSSPRYE